MSHKHCPKCNRLLDNRTKRERYLGSQWAKCMCGMLVRKHIAIGQYVEDVDSEQGFTIEEDWIGFIRRNNEAAQGEDGAVGPLL